MRAFASPRDLVDALARRPVGRSTLLVGVDGCGASGKSAVASWIARELGDVPIVHVDDFYLPQGAEAVGGHFDWKRLEREVLSPLAAGRAARYQVYDWSRNELGEWRDVAPGGRVVVEGVTAMRREIAARYDLTIWVECPRELRLARGLARDGEGARAQWVEDWMAAEDRYIAEHRPGERADLVVDGATFLPSP